LRRIKPSQKRHEGRQDTHAGEYLCELRQRPIQVLHDKRGRHKQEADASGPGKASLGPWDRPVFKMARHQHAVDAEVRAGDELNESQSGEGENNSRQNAREYLQFR